MVRRRNKNRLLVPEAAVSLEFFKGNVMRERGYQVNMSQPQNVKYEVARTLGIPLEPGYNGKIQAEQAGKVGGHIGGNMVREMIRMAEQRLTETQK
ncbi:alpha/beta-type small acid-soluble spore protein [Paenibacillus xerothermodurans]|uniref:Small acid-soluble spore protein n=1 Tax=Paenibacillus xerothermodurans TaxID=1977292 RepID=A0A2W1N966_PAEXE|nr:alpha/beta-type small acid-soluble spore protein [Paenibacillus xerothermodurans]PZE21179.1 small acid-soluble spore protein [Paenibacillus xerothermodurans]